MIKPGYVTSLDPFLVYLVGEDENEDGLPCERRAAAEIGMRGGVDSSTGSRVWVGEYDGDGIPFALRESLSQVNERIEGLVGVGNSNATEIDDVAEIVAVAQQAAADAVAEADAAMQKALDAIDAANQVGGDAGAAQAVADQAIIDAAAAQAQANQAVQDAADAYADAVAAAGLDATGKADAALAAAKLDATAKSNAAELAASNHAEAEAEAARLAAIAAASGDATDKANAAKAQAKADAAADASAKADQALAAAQADSQQKADAALEAAKVDASVKVDALRGRQYVWNADGTSSELDADGNILRTNLARDPHFTEPMKIWGSEWLIQNQPVTHMNGVATMGGGSSLYQLESLASLNGLECTVTVWARGNGTLIIRPGGTTDSNRLVLPPSPIDGEFQPLTAHYEAIVGNGHLVIGVEGSPGDESISVEIDRVLLVSGPVATPYFDGDTPDYGVADALARADQANNLAATAKANAQIADDKAAAANTLAGEANTAAGFAQAAAVGAQSTADSAESAAAVAASAAATAQQKANQAATDLTTLAGKTGETIRQTSAPTGARANARNLWIRLPDGKLHGYDGTNWVPITDPALAQAAADVITAQNRADKGVEDAALAKTAADQAATAASLAQSKADAADAKASTADGRYTVATRDPMMSDGEGKPIDAVWEVRSGFTAARRFVWVGGPPSWVQVKIGPDFVGDKAIGRAQIGDAAIGTLQVGDAQITNAKIGSLSVGKLDVLNGTFKTAVIDTLVGQSAFLDALHVRGAITIGGPNKVDNILLADGAVTSRVMKADEVFVGLKLASPVIETSTHATTGIKIIGDRLVGYGSGNEKQIDIGGPEGLIKGVTLEGVTVNGGSFKTNAGTDGYVDMRSYGASHSVKAVGTAGRTAFSLSGITGPEEYGIMQLFGTTQGRELFATPHMLAFRDSNGTGQNTLEIQNNAIGPAIRSHKKPLYLSSDHGIYINQVDVAGREVVTLSSAMKMVKQGRTRELYFDQSGTWSSGSVVASGTIPAADRPTLGDARGTVYLSGNGFNPGAATVTLSGTVNVINPNSVAQTRARGHVVWTV